MELLIFPRMGMVWEAGTGHVGPSPFSDLPTGSQAAHPQPLTPTLTLYRRHQDVGGLEGQVPVICPDP